MRERRTSILVFSCQGSPEKKDNRWRMPYPQWCCLLRFLLIGLRTSFVPSHVLKGARASQGQQGAVQKSTYLEETVQEQLEINPQQEEEERWQDKERVQSSPEEQREESRTPEELFLEHFTAEPVRDEVRDEILEEEISDQVVMKTV